MLYKCIMSSLSEVGKNKIDVWRDQFFEAGQPSGVLLLKIVLRESHIDSNATASSIRTQMSKLYTYIEEVGDDIVKFNTHVQMLIQGLAARGETSTDLLIYLFAAYKAVKDKEFVKYIKEKESRYEEGEPL